MRRLLNSIGKIELVAVFVVAPVVFCPGCRTAKSPNDSYVRAAVERYAAQRAAETALPSEGPRRLPEARACQMRRDRSAWQTVSKRRVTLDDLFTLGTFGDGELPEEGQPTTRRAKQAATFAPPEDYWRQDIWHQMGHEAKALGGHDFWKGFKTSFWDAENALVLTATMGASIAIRETGVDDTVRRRTRGHRQLGDFDEALQILANPGTHFAATGVLWLGSALTKDMKGHELAKTLTQALAVNGVSTLILKAAANTRSPDGGRYAWPSGHTSSVFTVAAVLNEYYGPWVGVPSLALAGLCGYQRLDSRVHDFSDVVFGGMMGYIIGSSIARDEKAAFPELFGMQVMPFLDPETGATGLALHKRW